jgi:hypothetical protein
MAAVDGFVVILPEVQEGYAVAARPATTSPLPPHWMKVHRMRAYDQTLARDVYWDSGSVDLAGNDYTGPGPLQDVVVSKIFEGRYSVC